MRAGREVDVKVGQAVASRRSVRAFVDRAVEPDMLRRLLVDAARAPSGGNLQPWHIHVVIGERLVALKQVMADRLEQAPAGEGAEYPIYPPDLAPPYRERRFRVGEALYQHLGIARADKAARRAWFARNYAFFGAPVGLFCVVDRNCGAAQWSDLGMYLQTVMLLLREQGLDSCPQECWALYHRTVATFLALPPHQMLFCGMAVGYADEQDAANRLRSERAPADEFLTFHS